MVANSGSFKTCVRQNYRSHSTVVGVVLHSWNSRQEPGFPSVPSSILTLLNSVFRVLTSDPSRLLVQVDFTGNRVAQNPSYKIFLWLCRSQSTVPLTGHVRSDRVCWM